MKIFFLIFFIMLPLAHGSTLNQSFFCSHKNGKIFYLQVDLDSNLGLTTVRGKGAYYGKYVINEEGITLDVPENNFFEKSVTLSGTSTFIYRFTTESLKCLGIKS